MYKRQSFIILYSSHGWILNQNGWKFLFLSPNWRKGKCHNSGCFGSSVGFVAISLIETDGLVPVSYTHLDVYKRQLQCEVRVGRGIKEHDCVTVRVHYIHKRQ